MPLYEYACKKCENRFEKLVRTAKEEKPPCPTCGSKQTSREISVFAAVSKQSSAANSPAPGCGRCGGPGPCAGGF